MLRKATPSDFNHIMDMVNTFIESDAPFRKHTTQDKLSSIVSNVLTDTNNDSICLLYDDVGMIIGTTTTFVFGDERQGVELGWWVKPEARKTGAGQALVEGFEQWCRDTGCTILVMGSLDDRVASLYEKNGFVLYERSYFKELK